MYIFEVINKYKFLNNAPPEEHIPISQDEFEEFFFFWKNETHKP